MRSPSKIVLVLGVSCLASATVASGAMAKDGRKFKPGLTVEVRGVVTAITPAATPTSGPSITVSPGFGVAGSTLAPWTCMLRPGTDTSAVVLNTTAVKMTCRLKNGVLVGKRARISRNTIGKVEVEASGVVTAFTPPAPVTLGLTPPPAPTGSITINAGTAAAPVPVTCAFSRRLRVRTAPVLNVDMASVECKTKRGVLVAKKIKVKRAKRAPIYGVSPGKKKDDGR